MRRFVGWDSVCLLTSADAVSALPCTLYILLLSLPFPIRKVAGVVTHDPVGYCAALAIGIMAGGAAGTLSADK